MSGTQETINETMQVMHAVPLSPYDDKSKRGPYLRSESGDVCDFYFFSLTEHGQRDKMILHPNAHEKAERLAACWNYCRGIPTAALEGEAKCVIETLRSQLARARKLLAIKPRWVCVKCGYYAGHSGCHPCKNCGASRDYWCGSFKWPADNEHCRNWIAADNARIDAALAAGEGR